MSRYLKNPKQNHRARLAFGLMLTVLTGCHAVNTPYQLGPLLGSSATSSPASCSDCSAGEGCISPGGALPARLCERVQDNFINRKIAEYKEAKSLPPWPRFHPLPTRPVFYPAETPEIELQPELLGSFQPH